MARKGSPQLVLFEGISPDREESRGPSIFLDDWGRRTIRRLMIKGDPWWVLGDVAAILGYRDAYNAGRLLRAKHKGTHLVSTPGGEQEMTIISEAGLYRLMMRSDAPAAEAFQDWIAEEVLPSIRKYGYYSSRSGRIDRLARRLKTEDPSVLIARQDDAELNARINRWLADAGFKPTDFINFHDGVHVHVSGRRPRDIRPDLGLKRYQSVLDRMGPALLRLHSAVKELAIRFIKDEAERLGEFPSVAVQRELVANAAEAVLSGPLQAMGFEYVVGLRDDTERGRTIDLIRRQIESPN